MLATEWEFQMTAQVFLSGLDEAPNKCDRINEGFDFDTCGSNHTIRGYLIFPRRTDFLTKPQNT